MVNRIINDDDLTDDEELNKAIQKRAKKLRDKQVQLSQIWNALCSTNELMQTIIGFSPTNQDLHNDDDNKPNPDR